MSQEVSDLSELENYSPEAVLDHLKRRYASNAIYTKIASILVAINPYTQLPRLYSDDILARFQHSNDSYRKNVPHVWGIAQSAYEGVMLENETQSIVISGESGSGKTESFKYMVLYLSRAAFAKTGEVKDSATMVQDRLFQANPILENFGNCKTIRNDNSSRFGKFVTIRFAPSGEVAGAKILHYLLEKSRVVSQSYSERSYHAFYLVSRGLSEDLRQSLQILDAEDYTYLCQSGCTTLEGVDEEEEMGILRESLELLKFTEAQQIDMFRIISGLLRLGNVTFEDAPNESSKVSNVDVLHIAADILQVDRKQLELCLTCRQVSFHGEGIKNLPLKKQHASDARDAMAKAIYARLFDWIIGRLNESLSCSKRQKTREGTIGVLDIFGFEIFDVNLFEQLCINYANEKLQQHFNLHVFKTELSEYQAEGISIDHINYVDNQDILDLIDSRKNPLGVLAHLDEQCSLKHSNDQKFADVCHSSFQHNANYGMVLQDTSLFIVKHYAGEVTYDTQGMSDKNKDKFEDSARTLMTDSQCALLKTVFLVKGPAPVQQKERTRGKMSRGGAKKKKRVFTLAREFQEQLADLVERLEDSCPSFVRCIKPNSNKKKKQFDNELILEQMRYSGLVEAIRIRRSGYSYRATYENFFCRYRVCLPQPKAKALLHNANGDYVQASKALRKHLADLTHEGDLGTLQLGKTKVFVREHQRVIMEKCRERGLFALVAKVQANYRGYRTRMYFCRVKALAQRVRDGMSNRKLSEVQEAISYAQSIPDIELYLTKQAQQLEKELKHELRTRNDIVSAVKAENLETLESILKHVDDIDMEQRCTNEDVLAEIRKSRDFLHLKKAQRNARTALKDAADARDVDALQEAISAGVACKLVDMELESYKQLLQKLLYNREVTEAVEVALEDDDIRELESALAKASGHKFDGREKELIEEARALTVKLYKQSFQEALDSSEYDVLQELMEAVTVNAGSIPKLSSLLKEQVKGTRAHLKTNIIGQMQKSLEKLITDDNATGVANLLQQIDGESQRIRDELAGEVQRAKAFVTEHGIRTLKGRLQDAIAQEDTTAVQLSLDAIEQHDNGTRSALAMDVTVGKKWLHNFRVGRLSTQILCAVETNDSKAVTQLMAQAELTGLKSDTGLVEAVKASQAFFRQEQVMQFSQSLAQAIEHRDELECRTVMDSIHQAHMAGDLSDELRQAERLFHELKVEKLTGAIEDAVAKKDANEVKSAVAAVETQGMSRECSGIVLRAHDFLHQAQVEEYRTALLGCIEQSQTDLCNSLLHEVEAAKLSRDLAGEIKDAKVFMFSHNLLSAVRRGAAEACHHLIKEIEASGLVEEPAVVQAVQQAEELFHAEKIKELRQALGDALGAKDTQRCRQIVGQIRRENLAAAFDKEIAESDALYTQEKATKFERSVQQAIGRRDSVMCRELIVSIEQEGLQEQLQACVDSANSFLHSHRLQGLAMALEEALTKSSVAAAKRTLDEITTEGLQHSEQLLPLIARAETLFHNDVIRQMSTSLNDAIISGQESAVRAVLANIDEAGLREAMPTDIVKADDFFLNHRIRQFRTGVRKALQEKDSETLRQVVSDIESASLGGQLADSLEDARRYFTREKIHNFRSALTTATQEGDSTALQDTIAEIEEHGFEDNLAKEIKKARSKIRSNRIVELTDDIRAGIAGCQETTVQRLMRVVDDEELSADMSGVLEQCKGFFREQRVVALKKTLEEAVSAQDATAVSSTLASIDSEGFSLDTALSACVTRAKAFQRTSTIRELREEARDLVERRDAEAIPLWEERLAEEGFRKEAKEFREQYHAFKTLHRELAVESFKAQLEDAVSAQDADTARATLDSLYKDTRRLAQEAALKDTVAATNAFLREYTISTHQNLITEAIEASSASQASDAVAALKKQPAWVQKACADQLSRAEGFFIDSRCRARAHSIESACKNKNLKAVRVALRSVDTEGLSEHKRSHEQLKGAIDKATTLLHFDKIEEHREALSQAIKKGSSRKIRLLVDEVKGEGLEEDLSRELKQADEFFEDETMQEYKDELQAAVRRGNSQAIRRVLATIRDEGMANAGEIKTCVRKAEEFLRDEEVEERKQALLTALSRGNLTAVQQCMSAIREEGMSQECHQELVRGQEALHQELMAGLRRDVQKAGHSGQQSDLEQVVERIRSHECEDTLKEHIDAAFAELHDRTVTLLRSRVKQAVEANDATTFNDVLDEVHSCGMVAELGQDIEHGKTQLHRSRVQELSRELRSGMEQRDVQRVQQGVATARAEHLQQDLCDELGEAEDFFVEVKAGALMATLERAIQQKDTEAVQHTLSSVRKDALESHPLVRQSGLMTEAVVTLLQLELQLQCDQRQPVRMREVLRRIEKEGFASRLRSDVDQAHELLKQLRVQEITDMCQQALESQDRQEVADALSRCQEPGLAFDGLHTLQDQLQTIQEDHQVEDFQQEMKNAISGGREETVRELLAQATEKTASVSQRLSDACSAATEFLENEAVRRYSHQLTDLTQCKDMEQLKAVVEDIDQNAVPAVRVRLGMQLAMAKALLEKARTEQASKSLASLMAKLVIEKFLRKCVSGAAECSYINGTYNARPDKITVAVLGDAGVGKSSLVTCVVSGEWFDTVVQKMDPVGLSPENTPENVQMVISDTSSHPGDIKDVEESVTQADAVVLLVTRHEWDSVERVRSHWLAVLEEWNVKVPLILGFSKCEPDMRPDTPNPDHEDTVNDLKRDFMHVELSSFLMNSVYEPMHLAQRAVLYPVEPLHDRQANTIPDNYAVALRRVFSLCDSDRDGLLNLAELNEFLSRSFSFTLTESDYAPMLKFVRSEAEEQPQDNGHPEGEGEGQSPRSADNKVDADVDGGVEAFSWEDFLSLHLALIRRGLWSANWASLCQFGYELMPGMTQDEHFVLMDCAIPRVPLHGDDESVEMSAGAVDFLKNVFMSHDADKDGKLDADEVQLMFRGCPKIPLPPHYLTLVESDAGGLTLNGWLALWSHMTYFDARNVCEALTMLGYTFAVREPPVLVNTSKQEDALLDSITRNTVRCLVFGSKGCGKSTFLNGLLGRPRVPLPYQPTDGLNTVAHLVSTVSEDDMEGQQAQMLGRPRSNRQETGTTGGGQYGDTPTGTGTATATGTDDCKEQEGDVLLAPNVRFEEPAHQAKECFLIATEVPYTDGALEESLSIARTCDLVVLMFDVANPQSLSCVVDLVEQLPDSLPMVFVAGKQDMPASMQVMPDGSPLTVQEICELYELPPPEPSSLPFRNRTVLFDNLVQVAKNPAVARPLTERKVEEQAAEDRSQMYKTVAMAVGGVVLVAVGVWAAVSMMSGSSKSKKSQ